MSFDALGLSPELLRAVAEQGYTEPTPIQQKAIPVVLAGQDVQAAAQTGTGKTAGFTLPILHRLQPMASSSPSPARHPVRALVLTPTRELAAQVEESVKAYSKYVPLRSTVIYGGVAMPPQVKALMAGAEIVVATPGRLLDHVEQRTINLSQVQILVLDEADRMLDMGFIPDIRRIVSLLPKTRQNLLFSATFTEDIKKLAGGILNNPVLIEVARRNATADLVEQRVYPVHTDRKRELLSHLIKTLPMEQAIVFMRTKQGANRLCAQLIRDGINAAAIHSDKSQSQRMESLTQFKEGQVNILVATDIAARGLDIDQLPYVVNFELPNVPEDYVHRIGRTGRAGAQGHAFSLVCEEESRELAEIEKLIKHKIEAVTLEQFQGRRSLREERPQREERTRRHEERSQVPAEPQPEAPVRRTVPPPEARTSVSSHHFSRPPMSIQRKPREVAALLGGFPKPVAPEGEG
jgi:ATP-dependent RNA helicase RhlE